METIQTPKRGSWLLVHVLDKAVNGSTEVTREIYCGYTLFKDWNLVPFHTKDLAETPVQDVEGLREWKMKFTYGLATWQRWMENESMKIKTMEVPCCVVSYNVFMNSVDPFDLFRSNNTIMRREKRVPISIFIYLLYASIQNAFTLFQSITFLGEVNYELHEFKRQIAAQFLEHFLEGFRKNTTLRAISTERTEKVTLQGKLSDSPLQNHSLFQNIGHTNLHYVFYLQV